MRTTSWERRNTPRPEYFLGEGGSPRSDIFSLGVIAYQMLTGRLPYGTQVAKARTKSQQRKLRYRSALDDNREIPAWIDGALKKAVASRSISTLRGVIRIHFRPSASQQEILATASMPLFERDPLLFWKCLSAIFLLHF